MINTDATGLQNLKDELMAERNWRVDEFTRIKLLLRRIEENESQDYADTYLKMTVPMLYSHWEGFCVASFKLVSEYINAMELDAKEVTYHFLTYANKDAYDKLKGKQSFQQKVEFSKMFASILFGKITIRTRVNTKSNLNAKALKEIFEEFQMDYSSLEEYSSELSTFVNVRNAIAHGQNNILIDKDKMNEYINLVVTLIDRVLLAQIYFLEEQMYRKK